MQRERDELPLLLEVIHCIEEQLVLHHGPSVAQR